MEKQVSQNFKNISELIQAIADARGEAHNEALRDCGYKGVLRSRLKSSR